MASRRDIREAFYAELEDAVSAYVSADDITQEFPNVEEELPKVVHADDYRKVPMNGASANPHDIVRDDSGAVEQIVFYSMMEAQFGVSVVDSDEQRKEDTYEALRRHFEKFEHGFWDANSIQADAHDITVNDSTSDDAEDRDPIARSDNVTINIGFKRDFRVLREDLTGQYSSDEYDDTFSGTIQSVDTLVDVRDDGTVEETYTTT